MDEQRGMEVIGRGDVRKTEEERFGVSNEGTDIEQVDVDVVATKTSSSNSSQSLDDTSAKSSPDPDYHPDNSQPASDVEIHVKTGTRKQGEEQNNEGPDHEVDIAGYRCGICNEDVETAEALTLHKHDHQHTLSRNPKRSKKRTDHLDHMAEEGVAAVVPASPKGVKPSSMLEEHTMSCSECGKWFMSWKALFGHMRCHPERAWRGIQPPNNINRLSKSPPSVASLPRVVKGKESTPSDQLFGSPPLPAPIQVQYHKANSRRKRGNDSDTESIHEDADPNIIIVHCASWSTGKRSRRHHPATRQLHFEQSVAVDSIAKTVETCDTLEDQLPQTETKTLDEAQAVGLCTDDNIGGGRFDVAPGTSPTLSTFKCVTCKKQFTSHQALGGHRANSKMMNGCRSRINAKGEEAESGEQEKTTNYNSPAINDDKEEILSIVIPHHECSICHRVFESGQALGGHKRCHWNGGVIDRRQRIAEPGVGIRSPAKVGVITARTNFKKPVQGAEIGLQRELFIEGMLDLNLRVSEAVEDEMAEHDQEMSKMEVLEPGHHVEHGELSKH